MLVYFVNLSRQPERCEQFLRTNEGVADFRRFEAVDGRTVREEDLIAQNLVAEPLHAFTPRSYGSALSHFTLWNHCVETGSAITVCEDDAIFNKHFASKAVGVLARLPEDWDLVRWSWNFDSVVDAVMIPGLRDCLMRFDPHPLGEELFKFQQSAYDVVALRLIQAFGISCYTISPKGARQMTSACFPLRNEVVEVRGLERKVITTCLDSTMNNYYRLLQCYICCPPLVWSENVKSDARFP